MSTSSKNKLQGKVTIVTGGASGIGEATVLLFADHGARAVVIADVQDEKGQKLVESIGSSRSTYIHCDVTDENQVKSLIKTTIDLYGQLDVTFCNAGIINTTPQTVLDFDMAAYEKLFAVNVGGTAASLKHAAMAMVEGGVKKGSIICTASTAANVQGDRCTDYVMSKCAVVGLMKSASVQLGRYGIRVNCVSPGPVATPLLCKLSGIGMKEVEKAFESSYCLGGVLKVKHVAEAVLFLACDDSEFVTGHNLVVDGGFKAAY
ncbi:hypothetical protein JCGZ_11576 [Jatropha curcas]|uniref:Uncharacterized protein n=1 Tax=Jatropha curcas TaxID=180498 RepID=A0A067KG42_JATCU|nr:(-)-isopiperitenol/(-)-carveol dehydrogenase, mitochondrial [Jatropha curcas]KDP31200.1 hypothetical protein JCGZ_11576 [Jatropha curcas]